MFSSAIYIRPLRKRSRNNMGMLLWDNAFFLWKFVIAALIINGKEYLKINFSLKKTSAHVISKVLFNLRILLYDM